MVRACTGEWSIDHVGVETVAIADLTAVLSRVVAERGREVALRMRHHLARLPMQLQPVPSDVRVALRWNQVGAECEMHVLEPGGHVCSPFTNRTANGSFMSRPIPAGLGVVEYVVPRAVRGTYQIAVALRHRTLPTMLGVTLAEVVVHTNFGRAEAGTESEHRFIVPLVDEGEDRFPVCTIVVS